MSQATYDEQETTGWVGWIAFAGVDDDHRPAALNAFYGLIAVVNDEWVVFGPIAPSLYLDISQWGWVHLLLGLVLLLSGIGVFSGNVLARTVGVIAAARQPDRELRRSSRRTRCGPSSSSRSTC